MKLFVYLFLGISFLTSATAAMAEIPPVLELYRQETIKAVKKGLLTHMEGKDYTVNLKVTVNKTAEYVGEGLEIKRSNGEIPESGLYLPQVKDVLGETKYLLGKVSLKVNINKELDEENALVIKNQIAKWAKINPTKGDVFSFDYRLKPHVAVQLPAAHLEPEIAEEPILTGLPLKETGLTLLAVFLLFWGLKKAIITEPKTDKKRETTMERGQILEADEEKELFEGLENLENLDLEAEVDLNTNFDLDMDFELNIELDSVIQEAEEAIFESEQLLEEEAPFAEILIETQKQQSQHDFGFLGEASLEKLQRLITKETAVVRALILNQLPLAMGEELYQMLSEDEQFSATCEISNLSALHEEDLLALSLELKQKLSKLGKAGLTLAASKKATETKAAIDFQFENIADLPFKFITSLVSRIVLVDLGIALSHAPKNVREKMLLCLDSQRRKEFIRSATKVRANEFDSFAKQELILKLASDLAHAESSDLVKIANC